MIEVCGDSLERNVNIITNLIKRNIRGSEILDIIFGQNDENVIGKILEKKYNNINNNIFSYKDLGNSWAIVDNRVIIRTKEPNIVIDLKSNRSVLQDIGEKLIYLGIEEKFKEDFILARVNENIVIIGGREYKPGDYIVKGVVEGCFLFKLRDSINISISDLIKVNGILGIKDSVKSVEEVGNNILDKYWYIIEEVESYRDIRKLDEDIVKLLDDSTINSYEKVITRAIEITKRNIIEGKIRSTDYINYMINELIVAFVDGYKEIHSNK